MEFMMTLFLSRPSPARSSRLRTGSLAVMIALGLALPAYQGAAAPAEKPASIAKVNKIIKGLAVQPPHKTFQKGKTSMPLYNQYFLRTGTSQKASIQFKDGTTLHMNQKTDAVLTNPHTTVVKSGEVNEILKPGTNHTIQTATAVAAAIGTTFDVRINKKKKKTFFIVVDGAVLVKTQQGSVLVKNNQETIVQPNKAPSAPQPVDARAATSWTNNLPAAPPSVGQNLALDANGGKVVGFSSQYSSPSQGPFWEVTHINDGRLEFGWDSDVGKVTNQFVTIGFFHSDGTNYTARLTSVILDCGPTNGDTPDESLKDFEIRVSTTGTADADFTTVPGSANVCPQDNALHTFPFSSPVDAKYIQLVAKDNYGSPDWLTVAEFEAVGTPAP